MKKTLFVLLVSGLLLSVPAFSQVTQQQIDKDFSGTCTGTDTYSVTISKVTAAAPYNFQTIYIDPGHTNTGAATLRLTGKSITYSAIGITSGGNALIGGELIAGQIYILKYSSVTSKWEMAGTATMYAGTNIGISGDTISTIDSPTFSTSVTTPQINNSSNVKTIDVDASRLNYQSSNTSIDFENTTLFDSHGNSTINYDRAPSGGIRGGILTKNSQAVFDWGIGQAYDTSNIISLNTNTRILSGAWAIDTPASGVLTHCIGLPTSGISDISTGTYTPTFSNGVNTTTVTVNGTFKYQRIGNYVKVFGIANVTETTTLIRTDIDISLPIASNFSTGGVTACVGQGTYGTGGVLYVPCIIYSNGSNPGAATVDWTGGPAAGSNSIVVNFSYYIY